MNHTLSMTFFLLVVTSCLNEKRYTSSRWELDSYQGTAVCNFTVDSLSAKNELIEIFLGLDDSAFSQTTLRLLDKGEFNILKNNNVRTIGTWERTQNSLRLYTGANSWKLEVIKQDNDSLVLKADGYPYMGDMEIVLR